MYKDRAEEKYKQYASLPNVHEQAAELSKILEKRDLMLQRKFEAKKDAKVVKESQIREQNIKRETDVDDLLSQYSGNYEQKPEKFSFWEYVTDRFSSFFSK